MTQQIENIQKQTDNYIDLLFHYVIEHPERLSDLYFLKFLIRDADFIIFYYVEEFNKEQAKLTKYNLNAAMQRNKLNWINPKSKFMRHIGAPDITKTFISSYTNEALNNQQDYANLLEKIVLKRYDEIVSTPLLTGDDFEVLRRQAIDTGNVFFAREIITNIKPLLDGTKSELIFNGVRFELKDILAYIQANLSYYNLMTVSTETSDYAASISRTLAASTEALFPTLAFNLGKPVFTNPQEGFLISIVAAEKLGKTRFVLGELVLPTMLLGKNVLYLSGEMQPEQIIAILLVKFMYIQGVCRMPENIVRQLLSIVNKIRANVATEADIKRYNKFAPKIKEAVILAENELFYSGKYGKLIIRHISDDIGASGKSKYFTVEEYFPLIRAEIDNMDEKERYALIVRDHVNHMSSISGLKPVEYVTKYLQEAKTLCTQKGKKFVYVVINHITTELADQIKKQGNVDGLKLRGHNSNEEGKTADLQFFLYERQGQRSEGQMTIVCENNRFCNIEEIFKTKEFVLDAQRDVADFKFLGCKKQAYPTTEDELEQFVERNKIGKVDSNG